MKQVFMFSLFLAVGCSGGLQLADDRKWAMQPIVKLDDANPVLEADPKPEYFCSLRKELVHWEEKDVFNPTALVKDERVVLLYRAQDKVGAPAGTSRIGLATSRDGLQFTKQGIPVLAPGKDKMKEYEWEGGCEDPRVFKRDDGMYVMTYTAFDGSTARLCIASSRDLQSWQKQGLAFDSKKYRDKWSKSGAVVCSLVKNEIVATKIKGKYWMYWGDTNLFLATSDDLMDWKPVEDPKTGEPLPVLTPRPGFFDSRLVEPGPFALITKNGILLLYNSSNDAVTGDKNLADHAYVVGQALFAAEKPAKLIARANRHFLHPERRYEVNGQVNNVCFLEGMVWFNNRWLLYYGTADSKIAVGAVDGQR
jgi:predicted GH43/DUF377 family glycosyl hydrolase